ncbi:MAG: NTP transferase domain-containing protein [Erysipelotrichaceae bacterium]|nr:NTP transferase domain-containing protein [Erysipelotrichaceae bacterium]
MEYRELLISKEKSIKEAMAQIGSSGPKILFVVENEKLLGSLTDGDIRRYLMAGGKIEDSVYDACNRQPKKIAHSLEEARGMLSKHFIAIPITDENNKITDIYIGSSSYKEIYDQIDVPVVINAGGKGTRLEPFTKVLPKPLIPVGDLPIIEHIMRRYEQFGCKRFSLIVNYKKELIKTYFKEIENKYQINWFDEEEPLGTGGGLSLLKDSLHETFFFISCDSLLLSDYSDIFKYHRQKGNDITMICAYKNVTIPYGVVNIDEEGSYKHIDEKPEFSFLTNTAMYVVEPSLLNDIEENQRIDFPQFIEAESKKGKKIGVYPIGESEWLDMGQMSELEKMRIRLYGE